MILSLRVPTEAMSAPLENALPVIAAGRRGGKLNRR